MPDNAHVKGSITVWNALVSSWTPESGQLSVHKPISNVTVDCRAEGMKLTTISVPSGETSYHIRQSSLAQDMYVGEETTIWADAAETYTFTSENVSIAGGEVKSVTRGAGNLSIKIVFVPTSVTPVVTCTTTQITYTVTVTFANIAEAYCQECEVMHSGDVFTVVQGEESPRFTLVPATGWYLSESMISYPPEEALICDGGGWDAEGTPKSMTFYIQSVDENMTLVITPQKVYTEIRFDLNGGSGTVATKTVEYQNSTTLPGASGITPPDATANPGKYYINGWHREKLNPGASDGVTPDFALGATYEHTENKVKTIKLYALYKTTTYTVSLNATASNCYFCSGQGTPYYEQSYTVKYGESTPRLAFGVGTFGYSLNTWTGIKLDDTSRGGYTVDAPEEYPFTDMNYWNSSINMPTISCGDLPYLLITNVKGNLNVSFETTPIRFRVSFWPNKPKEEGTDITISVPDDVYATYNDPLDLSEEAVCLPSHYVFKGWKVGNTVLPDSLVPSLTTFPDEAHINVNASWEATDYTFSFNGKGTSTATNVPSSIARNGSVTITIVPNSGYTLDGISPSEDECE